jgi:hypothetical protein
MRILRIRIPNTAHRKEDCPRLFTFEQDSAPPITPFFKLHGSCSNVHGNIHSTFYLVNYYVRHVCDGQGTSFEFRCENFSVVKNI